MEERQKRIVLNSLNHSTKTEILERDLLLKKMGVGRKLKDVPQVITNEFGCVINPYFAAKLFSEQGFPLEMTLEEFKKKGINEWTDWCDFWFKSFCEIPHNILCDSKKYFIHMGWKE